LIFPGIIWGFLLLIELSYALFTNSYYFIPLGMHFFHYPTLFIQALWLIKWNRDSFNSCGISEKFIVYATYFVNLFIVLFWIYYNMFQDLHVVSHQKNHTIVFIQIVLENTLLLEYVHLTLEMIFQHDFTSWQKSRRLGILCLGLALLFLIYLAVGLIWFIICGLVLLIILVVIGNTQILSLCCKFKLCTL